MALTDADRLQIVAMALMRHSVVGGGSAPAEALINYFKKYIPRDNLEISNSHKVYGADITGGEPYIESSEYSATYTASKAFDDNDSTYWRPSGITTDEYVGVDFGSSQTIGLITFKSRAGYCVADFLFQGSNDGSSWSTLYSGTAANVSDVQYFAIGNTTAYRHYRLKNNGTPYGTAIRLYEIQMMEEE